LAKPIEPLKAQSSTAGRPVCYQCGSTSLRASHFRGDDLTELLMLHWPVRCRSCSERQFVSIFSVLTLPRR
jgi:DNA-directed RNA polymerase subunit RPC12/RpoP